MTCAPLFKSLSVRVNHAVKRGDHDDEVRDGVPELGDVFRDLNREKGHGLEFELFKRSSCCSYLIIAFTPVNGGRVFAPVTGRDFF